MFESDNEINNFLTLEEEFSSTNVDGDTMSEFDPTKQIESYMSAENISQMLHPTNFTKEEIQELKQIDVDEIIERESEIINLKDNHLP